MLIDAIRSLLAGGSVSGEAILMQIIATLFVIFCILPLHEFAHGWMAEKLGDHTARAAGRLTLNPLASLDPFGALFLLLFGFGWARPVPVNISNFKNRRTGMAATALAGPVANFVTAFVAYCLYFLVWIYGDSVFMQVVGEFLAIVASMSVGLGVFNLIPVHPLDGSRVLDAYLPFSWSLKIQKYQPVIILLFIFALWRGWLDIIMSRVASQILGLAARLMSLFL